MAPLLAPLLVATPLLAQDSSRTDSSRVTTLAPVSTTVTRDAARTAFELPFATARVTPDATRPGLRRGSIGELLLGVPGVVVQERANPSQDPRLAVRGFGARSAFGVRGVRVLRDGIPLSLPDGQTPVDWLDLETIGSIDVVRGTAAALYGNAAGGIVEFRSRAPENAPFALSSRALSGAGITRTNVTASGRSERSEAQAVRDIGWLASATGTHGNGARDWSRLDASSAFARAYATLLGTRVELSGTHYDAPRAENTGALTAGELARDPSLPDSLNVQRRSRKAVRQSQVALTASRTNGPNELIATAFTSSRTLDNPLPFAIVDVDRTVGGASLRGTRRVPAPWPLRFTAGADYQRQDDDRFNFENCNDVLPSAPVSIRCPTAGRERGAVRLEQRELVSGTGVFARAEIEAPGGIFASAAVRHDRVAFTVEDRFITGANPDDSGDRALEAVSPMFALVWRARPLLSFYANVANAFETPTVTELTNQDNGAAGLNRTLAPQRTSTLEVGMQSLLAGRVRVDVAAFRARVRDELVPFDVPNAPGRRAFRNAGRTSRDGVELSMATSAAIGAATTDVGVGYTYSNFRYDEYRVGASDFSGKPIPGIPVQALQAFTTVRLGGAFGTVDVTSASRSSADDAATVYAAGYAAWALRAGYRAAVAGGRFAVEPMAGVENLFDRRYAGSVVVNATRARYFEPGGRRRGYLGVRLEAR
jgi:iron complex outermembrane receptor protein